MILNYVFLKYGLKLFSLKTASKLHTVCIWQICTEEKLFECVDGRRWSCTPTFLSAFVALNSAKIKSLWKFLKKYFHSKFRKETNTNYLGCHKNNTGTRQFCCALFQSGFSLRVYIIFRTNTHCECYWAVVFLLRVVISVNQTAFSCLVLPTLVNLSHNWYFLSQWKQL